MELIAIDLDGTLADSVKDLHAAVVRMQRELSHEIASETDVRGWVGNGIERLVHRALTGSMEGDAAADQFDQALSFFRTVYAEVNGQYATLYPGVMEGLTWMATLDVPMVMVTNKASDFANPLLRHLGVDHFFSHCIAGDDVVAKKPDPESLLLAAKLCRARPTQSVLIGDSVSDFKAAQAAGFYSVGVSYGYNHGQSVHALKPPLAPSAVIDSFTDLPGVFAQLLP